MTTYTSILRLGAPTVSSDAGTWPVTLNTDMTLIEQSITGDNGYLGGSGGISIAGLTTYTLTSNNGSVDQARQLLYPFVGALGADCTVTLPASVKVGWCLNATTGSKNVILTTGSGTTLTVGGGSWVFFYCDGTNVGTPAVGFGGITALSLSQKDSNGLTVGVTGSKLAFFGGTPAVKATVTGSKGANAALTSLMTALVGLGLVTDTTS
jgi:hypothetical protein